MQLHKDTVEEEHNLSISEPFVGNPGGHNDQTGQEKGNVSRTQKYIVDHIVRHADEGCQLKYVM